MKTVTVISLLAERTQTMKTTIRTAIATTALTLTLATTCAAQYYPNGSPEAATLTPKEQHCRIEAQYMYTRAQERDTGWSLTDSLLSTRTKLQQYGISPSGIGSFDHMTRLAYKWVEATPAQIRQVWEQGCMQRPDSAFKQAAKQRTKPDTRTMGSTVPKTTNRY